MASKKLSLRPGVPVAAGSCPLETLSLKFKTITRALQSWSQKKIGHIRTQVVLAKEIIHQFEIAQDSRQLSEGELWLLHSLKKHSLALSSLQRTIARTRSRIGWETAQRWRRKYYTLHSHARHRKRKNFISKIISEEQVLTNHEDKAAAIYQCYDQLLGTCDQRDTRQPLTWMSWIWTTIIWLISS